MRAVDCPWLERGVRVLHQHDLAVDFLQLVALGDVEPGPRVIINVRVGLLGLGGSIRRLYLLLLRCGIMRASAKTTLASVCAISSSSAGREPS